MSKGTGYGKVILFGEHFVVHGGPAIAAGISNKAVVKITRTEKTSFTSSTPGCIPALTMDAISRVFKAMAIKDNFTVSLSGDLPTIGGLGSSAAFCVALVRALGEHYKLNLTGAQVNDYAFKGEYAFHGNPSGLDNTMATYGGAIEFVKNRGFDRLKVGKALDLVVAGTGKSSPTAGMVEKVRIFRENNPEEFQDLYGQAQEIVEKGKEALETGNGAQLGRLMNENHALLKAVGVSSELNEKVVSLFLKSGALGAKLTGGGGGGSCIALANDGKHAQSILESVKKAGFSGFVTAVAKTG